MEINASTIETSELTYGCLTAGDSGPLALCLHGFPDTAHGWRYLLPALADAGFRAVAPFMRGYAPTSIPADGQYHVATLARDATALHEALGGDGDAVIIGHDWGALATYGAAAYAPERWRRAVTAAVPPAASMATAMTTYDQLKRSWYMFFFKLVSLITSFRRTTLTSLTDSGRIGHRVTMQPSTWATSALHLGVAKISPPHLAITEQLGAPNRYRLHIKTSRTCLEHRRLNQRCTSTDEMMDVLALSSQKTWPPNSAQDHNQ